VDRTKKAWINGILLAITLVINTLGAIGLINGLSQKEVSDKYVTLITPGPRAFNIWGIIYSLLAISIIWMIIKKDDAYYQKAFDEISVMFWISCIMNIAWIVSFSFLQIGLSVIFIFVFTTTLSLILQKLRKIHTEKRFLLPLTFGIYTGWLFIATVVNTAAWLVKIKWDGFGIANQIWAFIMLVVAVFFDIFGSQEKPKCHISPSDCLGVPWYLRVFNSAGRIQWRICFPANCVFSRCGCIDWYGSDSVL
jgi:benzodiazapine receptor